MIKDDLKIQFLGFEPNQDAQSSLYYLIQQLQRKSPSQSIVNATFTFTNGIFEGVIKISSVANDFVAKATDVNLAELAEKLATKLGEQLDHWRTLRFE